VIKEGDYVEIGNGAMDTGVKGTVFYLDDDENNPNTTRVKMIVDDPGPDSGLNPGENASYLLKFVNLHIPKKPASVIKPGDRVRVIEGHRDAGLEGRVTYSLDPWNRKQHMVLITNTDKLSQKVWMGRCLSFFPENLEVIDFPVEKSGGTNLDAALDDVLFNV
jgi:ribosomal protein L24